MSHLVRSGLFAACAALFAFGACVPEDIIVAAQQDSGTIVVPPPPPPESTPDAAVDAAPGDDEPVPRFCGNSQDCELGEFCAKRTCNSPGGVCQRAPLSCDDAGVNPVCGCDKLTYFNDCLRQRNGVNLARTSECREPRLCGGSREPCPSDSYCARLYPPNVSACEEDFPGVCWVLPTECDADSPSTDRYRRCDDPSGACVDRCRAIRTEVSYVVAQRCAE
jgi:hypothetical protein